MAAVQILKLAHHIKGGVEAVGVEVKGVGVDVKDVGDNVNQLIEGTFRTLAPHKCHLKPKKRLDGKEMKARMEEEKR